MKSKCCNASTKPFYEERKCLLCNKVCDIAPALLTSEEVLAEIEKRKSRLIKEYLDKDTTTTRAVFLSGRLEELDFIKNYIEGKE